MTSDAHSALAPDFDFGAVALRFDSGTLISLGDAWSATSLRFTGPRVDIVLDDLDAATEDSWILIDSADDARRAAAASGEGASIVSRVDSPGLRTLLRDPAIALQRLSLDGDLALVRVRTALEGDDRSPLAARTLDAWIEDRATLFARDSAADTVVDDFAALLSATSHLTSTADRAQRALVGLRKQHVTLQAKHQSLIASRLGKLLSRVRAAQRAMKRGKS